MSARRLSALAVVVATLVMAFSASFAASPAVKTASADSVTLYCQRSVGDFFVNHDRCRVGSTNRWNAAGTTWPSSGGLQFICATVSSISDGARDDGIYGSGCLGNSNKYSFCHAPVANSYYGWASQNRNGQSATLNGAMGIDRNCADPPLARSQQTSAEPFGTSKASSFDGSIAASKRAPAKAPAAVARLVNDSLGTTEVRSVGETSAVYLASAGDQACVALAFDDGGPGAAVGCGPADTFASQPHVAFTSTGDGKTRVWGTVPDGISSVTVNSADGAKAVPVVNNAVDASVVRPQGLEWVSSAGVKRAEVAPESMR
jgi:hypothetical protein